MQYQELLNAWPGFDNSIYGQDLLISISSMIGGWLCADQESASVDAPSGAGRTVPLRLKPHLPLIFALIR